MSRKFVRISGGREKPNDKEKKKKNVATKGENCGHKEGKSRGRKGKGTQGEAKKDLNPPDYGHKRVTATRRTLGCGIGGR